MSSEPTVSAMGTRPPRTDTATVRRIRWAGARPPFRGAVIETGPWTRRVSLALTILAIGFLTFQAFVSVLLALEHATQFDGFATNGAFQLYNPLRRLADGQTVGIDFPFFHGVGVPALHYPVFVALGGNLFASEMARWLLSPFLFALTGYIFFRVLLGNWQRAVIALALYLAIVIPRVSNIVDPGNSLMGIRTMTPLLIAAALLAPVRKQRRIAGYIQANTPLLLAYLLIGIGVALGTEQGLAAAGAFLLVRFVLNSRRLRFGWRLIVQTVVDVGASVASIIIVLSILTFGNAGPALEYALIEVPRDQGWVFGAVPNVTLTLPALKWELLGGATLDIGGEVPRYWLTALAALVLLFVASRMRLIGQREIGAFSFLWIYALAVLVSVLGYLNLADQLAPFGRVSAAIGAGLAVSVGLSLIARAEHSSTAAASANPGHPVRRRISRISALVAAAALAVTSFVLAGASIPARVDLREKISARAVISAAWAGPWATDYESSGPAWRKNLDTLGAYIAEGDTVWSTYSSLYESSRGIFNPAPGGEDYIIHALGAQRRANYQSAFIEETPDVVITMNPVYSYYEEWLWSRYPLFYERLLTAYTLTEVTHSHFLWLPREGGAQPQDSPVAATVSEDGVIALPANDTTRMRYYEVGVTYTAESGKIPVVNRLPRFYLVPDGAAMGLYGMILPPDETEWTLIVPVAPGSSPVLLSPAIAGIDVGAKLDIRAATYRALNVDVENDRLAEMNACFWRPETKECARE